MSPPRDARAAWPVLVFTALSACADGGPPRTVVDLANVPEAAPEPEEVIACAYTIDRRGVTECAAIVTAEAQRHRETTWLIRRRKGRAVRVERVNGSGDLVAGDDGAAAWDIAYDGARVREETYYTATRRLRGRFVYSADATRLDRIDAWGRPWRHEGTSYTAEVRDFDALGLVRSRRFFDAHGAPAKSAVGVHELRYRRDARGFVVEIEELDAAGKPTLNTERFHRMTYERDDLGNTLAERHFGVDGAPVATSHGAWLFRMTFDRWGNALDARFFDVTEKPAVDTRSAARWTATYDDRGNRIETAFFGVDGRPADGPNGWARTARRFDDQGRLVEWMTFDAAGRPTGDAPMKRARHDALGRIVERSYHDAGGGLRTEGYAFKRYLHDERDHEIEVTHHDASGQLVERDDGTAGHRTTYVEDRRTETSYFGADRLPKATRSGGYASVRYRYDAELQLLEEDRFDVDGRPVELFGAKHLLVMYKGARLAAANVTRSRIEARARAEAAHMKIVAGLAFEEAVKVYSDEADTAARGGDLGRFKSGRMVSEFEGALRALSVGQTSAVVETPFGFHVIVRTY